MNKRELLNLKRVNRAEFMAWCDGILLDFKNGVGIAPNERDCAAAEKALADGEKVLLIDHEGNASTFCFFDKALDGYVEEPIEKLLENDDD